MTNDIQAAAANVQRAVDALNDALVEASAVGCKVDLECNSLQSVGEPFARPVLSAKVFAYVDVPSVRRQPAIGEWAEDGQQAVTDHVGETRDSIRRGARRSGHRFQL